MVSPITVAELAITPAVLKTHSFSSWLTLAGPRIFSLFAAVCCWSCKYIGQSLPGRFCAVSWFAGSVISQAVISCAPTIASKTSMLSNPAFKRRYFMVRFTPFYFLSALQAGEHEPRTVRLAFLQAGEHEPRPYGASWVFLYGKSSACKQDSSNTTRAALPALC